MRFGLAAPACAALLILVVAAGYLVGVSSTPRLSEVEEAEQNTYDDAFEASEKQAATAAKQVALETGENAGRQAGSGDGERDASAEVAAADAAAGGPGTVDEFGIVRPEPGVSPEYDNCIAKGGTPSPDGCLP